MAKKDKKNYIAYADVARLLSAFAVVLLHVSGARLIREPIGSANFWWAAFFDCATRWSVPLFIMLSGMLFLNKRKTLNIKTLYTKNIFRMLTAFVFWSFVYNLYTAYANMHELKSAFFAAIRNIHNGAMHLWFMFVIVGLYIILPFVKRMCETMTKREAEGFLLLTFVPKTLSSYEVFNPFFEYINKFEISFAAGYVGLFVAGWYIDNFDHKRDTRITIYAIALAGFLYMFLTTVGFSIKRGTIADEFMSFKSVSAFVMAFGVMMFCKSVFGRRIFKRRTNSNLAFYSKYTFGIYLIHEMFLNISAAKGWFVLESMPYIGIPIEAATVFVISGIIVGLITWMPFGKYIS